MKDQEFREGWDAAMNRAREMVWGAYLEGFQEAVRKVEQKLNGLYASSGTPVLPRDLLLRHIGGLEPPEDFARQYFRDNGFK